MTAVFNYLAEQSVLLLFLLVGVGMLLGRIKVRGVSLGAAAVLFLAIIIAAWGQSNGVEVAVEPVIGTLGLLLFAFAIGNNSGVSFFRSLRHAAGPNLVMIGLFIVAASVAYVMGTRLFNMDIATVAGAFAGATTNTPALLAAGDASGDGAAATVGYAMAYLFGVIGMIAASGIALRHAANDQDAPSVVTHVSVRVERTDRPKLSDVLAQAKGNIQISRHRHGEEGPIWIPDDDDILEKDDLVNVVGAVDDVDEFIELLGHRSSHSLRADRRILDFRRITISEPKLAGKTIAELDKELDERWGAKISRVRRGDTDMLALPGFMVEMGDRVRVVGPTLKLKEISRWFGDSAKGLTDVNPVALGIGLAIGIFIGEIDIPVPGGSSFSLGAAAGVLIMGLIMGRMGRIGPLVTALPNTVNSVLAEFGLLIFLAQAGTRAGGQIVSAFTGGHWWKILILGAVITLIMAVGLYIAMRGIFKMGGTQLSGLLGGAQTQPAVMAFANGRTGSDPRVALGYALVYPVAMITKILVAQVLGGM
ncbi:MAG: transporter [Actinomycetaceae bacterium]|nr:transporter [Actinomycetaceae bacterium]MBE6485162.1 transporter [Actinomycetaceae bacterium]